MLPWLPVVRDSSMDRHVLGASAPGANSKVVHRMGRLGLATCVKPTRKPEIDLRTLLAPLIGMRLVLLREGTDRNEVQTL